MPVTTDSPVRLQRTGYLAHFLAEHGHEVVWWTSSFDHANKRHRVPADTTIHLKENLELILLHGCGYDSNVSFARLLDYSQLASKFSKQADLRPKPDVFLCSFPPIELSRAGVEYGQRKGVPVVLDLRDMWPEIFVDAFPGYLRRFAQIAVRPMSRVAQKAIAEAVALTGNTEEFVEWGLSRAGRTRTPSDRAFPYGYATRPPLETSLRRAEEYWDEMCVRDDRSRFVVCFIGNLGRALDVATIISAARRIGGACPRMQFVICGTGDKASHFRVLASDLPSVVFTGRIDSAQIYALLRRSAVGLNPLPDRYDFLATINNKVPEYFSAGLPIISSPDRGVLHDLLMNHQCGLSYPQGDIDTLVGILLKLEGDRVLLQRLSDNAGRLFQQMFIADKVCAEMMGYLEGIANEYHVRCHSSTSGR